MSDEAFEATTSYERSARMNKDILLEQAVVIYKLAMEEYGKNDHRYRLLMGVANLLYMLENGKYRVIVVEPFENMGQY